MATNYIYKYVRNDEIIYIGKTKNLQQRHKQHLQEAGKFLQTDKLYYFLCPTSNIMDVYETALINKYHPVLNKADNDPTIDIIIKEPDWYEYKESILKSKTQSKDFTNIQLTTSFKPKHLINLKNTPIYDSINFPLMSVAEWKLLLILKLQLAPITTRECIDVLYRDRSGERYNMIRKTAEKLFKKDLCKLIDKNTFLITQKGITLVPYTDEEICLMLSFTSKWTFALYPLIKEHKTIMVEDLKQVYKDYRDIRRNVIEPVIFNINTIFNKNYSYTTLKQGRSIAFITFTEK